MSQPTAALSDSSRQITEIRAGVAAGCDIGNPEIQNEFVVTGRGGLPSNSTNLINPRGVDIPWVTPSESESVALVNQESPSTSPTLVEAQMVAIDASGNMHFMARQDMFASSALQANASEFCQTVRQL